MSQAELSLPSGCVLRPAKLQDRFEIKKMIFKARNLDKITLVILIICILLISIFTFITVIQISISFVLAAWFLFQIHQPKVSKLWIIECQGNLAAFGTLYRHDTHSVIYNVFVAEAWRKNGLGSALINFLIQEGNKPIYLTCLPNRVGFYSRLGFIPVPWKETSEFSLLIQRASLVLMKYQ